MPYPVFDRSQLKLLPLAQRDHDMTLDDVLELNVAQDIASKDAALEQVAERVVAARRQDAPVILMMGAHVIKRGLSRFVVEMMERGILTHVAMNGAGVIHDYELALMGATTEGVARYIQEGQFGLWQETGQVNNMAAEAAENGLGLGEAAGGWIEREALAHREISILGAGFRLGVPVTVHLGIGQDITHEHPNCDGAALGAASYTDFLVLAHTVSQLQGGVMLNVGTAVMGPEVYLKALSMASRRPSLTCWNWALTSTPKPTDRTPATISGPTRPCWSAQSRTEVRASISRATTSRRFQPSTGWSWTCRSSPVHSAATGKPRKAPQGDGTSKAQR
jgi:hypothetical protein